MYMQHKPTAKHKLAHLLWMSQLTTLSSTNYLALEGPAISRHHHQHEPSNHFFFEFMVKLGCKAQCHC